METVRLRKIEQPSRLERLLTAFAGSSDILPPDSHRIRDPNALPPALQQIVSRVKPKKQVWGCWSNNGGIWLFSAEMSMPQSRERGTPILLINVYRQDGELKDSGLWLADSEKWQRYHDPDSP
jgi:hypothetical protein